MAKVKKSNTPTTYKDSETLPIYLTRFEAAKLLKISLVTLHDWTQRGILKAYRVAGAATRVYYKPQEIDAAMTEITPTKRD